MQKVWMEHLRRYPNMEAVDMLKLIFQAHLGCGHLLADEASVTARIAEEEATLSPAPEAPLTEALGPYFVRLNLPAAMARGIQPVWIARMMALSCQAAPAFTRQDAADCARRLSASVACGEELRRAARRLVDEPAWLPSHSDAYRTSYAPHYRVIGKEWELALQALSVIASHGREERLLVTIDGPCCSGKTTLAAQLAQVLDAAVVHMDDFYVPHARKTAERLAIPGGNADVERLCDEFLLPWLRDGHGSYRPYSCKEDRLLDPVEIPARGVTILEGSYANLPSICPHAQVRLFLRLGKQEQLQRLLTRDGEAHLPMFLERWIPLEEAYFAAYSLPDSGCTVLFSGASGADMGADTGIDVAPDTDLGTDAGADPGTAPAADMVADTGAAVRIAAADGGLADAKADV